MVESEQFIHEHSEVIEAICLFDCVAGRKLQTIVCPLSDNYVGKQVRQSMCNAKVLPGPAMLDAPLLRDGFVPNIVHTQLCMAVKIFLLNVDLTSTKPEKNKSSCSSTEPLMQITKVFEQLLVVDLSTMILMGAFSFMIFRG